MKKKLAWFFLKSISLLPLWVLYRLSDFIYLIVYHIVGYRKSVVLSNLSASFPNLSSTEIKKIAGGFYRFLCDVILESIKTISISDKSLKKRFIVVNPEIVNLPLSQNRSVVLFLGHYGNWEWVQEIGTYFLPSAYRGSIYLPLRNRIADDIMLSLRNRWHMHLLPQDKAVRALLDKENQPWVIGFIADQRPRFLNHDNYTDFLNHKTYFFTGPEDIGRKVGADFFYCEMERPKRGYYRLTFKPMNPEPSARNYPYTRAFYRMFQETIERDPAMWLWSHKRWKQQ